MDNFSTTDEELKGRLIQYLAESGQDGLKREGFMRRLRGEENPILPYDWTDADCWRNIRTILVNADEITVDGTKRGTTYFLRRLHDERDPHDPKATAKSMIDVIKGRYIEHHRFEKRSIPLLLRGKGDEHRHSTEQIEEGINHLVSTNELFREGTGRGTRYYWSEVKMVAVMTETKGGQSPQVERPVERKRVSVTLPLEIYGWLKSVVGDEMEYRSQSEVIEKALWECRSDEIAQWKREQED